jgi:hypothetical protein
MSGGGGSSGSVDNTAIGHGGGLPGGNNITGVPAAGGTPATTNTTATTTPTYSWNSSPPVTNPFSSQQIQSAIDTSRQQGFSNQDILTGLSRNGVNSGPQQNAVMAQVSGARPSSSDPQFYQPVYQGQYQNYASPLTAFNTSTYGTNVGPSNAQKYANLPGGIGQDQYMSNIQNYASKAMSQPGGADMNRTLQDMRTYGISPQDMQAASSYGAPQQSFTANNPFNAYTGSAYSPQQVRNAIGTSQQQGFSSQDIATGLGRNGVYLSPQQTQMYNPYTPPVVNQSGYIPLSDWRSALPPLPAQTNANTPRESFGQMVTGNTVNSITQGFPQQQPQQQYNPLQSMGLPNPYSNQPQQQQQMYNPFSYGGQQSYQQPQQQYNPYSYQPQQQLSSGQTYDYQPYQSPTQYQQQQPVIPTSSGPSQAIVGRSSMGRGTPNVMRRAEGGIIDLMDKT